VRFLWFLSGVMVGIIPLLLSLNLITFNSLALIFLGSGLGVALFMVLLTIMLNNK